MGPVLTLVHGLNSLMERADKENPSYSLLHSVLGSFSFSATLLAQACFQGISAFSTLYFPLLLLHTYASDIAPLYTKLRNLRDPSGCRVVYSKLLCGRKEVHPFKNEEDVRKFGENSIISLLEASNFWTIQSTEYAMNHKRQI